MPILNTVPQSTAGRCEGGNLASRFSLRLKVLLHKFCLQFDDKKRI